MNILVEKLKQLVLELKGDGRPDAVIINGIKEYLQYPILHFIYNHPKYSMIVMYGGTLLRIGYDLNRMSEDLDFQTDQTFDFEDFKNDLSNYFKKTHGVDVEVKLKTDRMTDTKQVIIKFPFLEELQLDHPWTVLKVKVDINRFEQTSDFMTESIPIVKDTYTFSIKTYPISSLMGSKIAAVLLRSPFDVGDKKSECKPRDVYDLMWYMEKKIMPNLEYIEAIFKRAKKPFSIKTPLELFNELEHKIVNLDDHAFKEDLAPLFYDPAGYQDWYQQWRDRFHRLREAYEIHQITELKSVHFSVDFSSDNRYFLFRFSTDEPGVQVKISCSLSEYWFMMNDLKIHGHRKKEIETKIMNPEQMEDLEYEYLGLFYEKIENYLKRNDRIVTQHAIQTKLIRATGDRLNVKKQVMMSRRLFEKCKFEDLL